MFVFSDELIDIMIAWKEGPKEYSLMAVMLCSRPTHCHDMPLLVFGLRRHDE